MGLKLASPWPWVVSVLYYIRVQAPSPQHFVGKNFFYNHFKTEQHNQVYFDTPQVFVAAGFLSTRFIQHKRITLHISTSHLIRTSILHCELL